MLYFFTVPAPDDLGDEHVVIFYDGDEKLETRKTDLEWIEGLVDAELPLSEYKLIIGQKDSGGDSHLFGKGNYLQDNVDDKLILQIDGRQFDDTFQHICGDGSIYFLVPGKELKKKNFKHAYATMQFT